MLFFSLTVTASAHADQPVEPDVPREPAQPAEAWGEPLAAPSRLDGLAAIESDATLPFSSRDIYRALAGRLPAGELPTTLPVIRVGRLGPTRVLVGVGTATEAVDLPDDSRHAGARDVALVIATMLHTSGAVASGAQRTVSSSASSTAMPTAAPALPAVVVADQPVPEPRAEVSGAPLDGPPPVRPPVAPARRGQLGVELFPGLGVHGGLSRRLVGPLWGTASVGYRQEQIGFPGAPSMSAEIRQARARGGVRLEYRWVGLETGLVLSGQRVACTDRGVTSGGDVITDAGPYVAASARVPVTARLRVIGEAWLGGGYVRSAGEPCWGAEVSVQPSLISFSAGAEYAF